jgi:hypothetical protein
MSGTMNDEQQDNLHAIEKYYRSAVDSIKKERNETINALFIPQTKSYMEPIRAYEKHLEMYFRREKKLKKWYMEVIKVRVGLQCMVDSVIGMVDLFYYCEIDQNHLLAFRILVSDRHNTVKTVLAIHLPGSF